MKINSGRRRALARMACAVAAGALTFPATALLAPAAHAATTPSVVSYPVTFTVVNTDQTAVGTTTAVGPLGSALPLATGDGKTYTVQGHITAPAGSLDLPNRAGALYVSGHGYGEWYWNLTQVPAFDYAANQAAAGLASITIDKIGYVSGGTPAVDGKYVGYGTEATVDHQILQELRAGQYTMSGHAPVPFSRLALVGGSQAAFSAEVEAYTFKDPDAVVLAGFADEGFSPGLLTNYGGNVAACTIAAASGQGSNGYPPDYAYRETTPAAFDSDDLGGADTSAQVTQVANTLHSEDPCGYPTYSVGPVLVTNNLETPLITKPLLSIMGDSDSEFLPAVALAYQQNVEFAANPDHTTISVPDTPQALTLSNTAPVFDADMAKWLCARDFGAYSGSCTAPVTTASTTPVATTLPTATGTSSALGAASTAAATVSTGSTASLPVTGDDTLRELAVALTLATLGGTIVGLSTVQVRRRSTRAR